MFKKALKYYTKSIFTLPHFTLYKTAYSSLRNTLHNAKQQADLSNIEDLEALKNKCLITAILYFSITFLLIINAYSMLFKDFDSLTKISSCVMFCLSICTTLYAYLFIYKYNIVKEYIQCKN